MTPFLEIFYVSLGLNVILTLHSSGYWGKIKSYFVSSSNGSSDHEDPEGKPEDEEKEGTAPLLSSSSTTTTSSKDSEVPTVVSKDLSKSRVHAGLVRRYLFVYLLAALSDWLQGPYVYALYGGYGFKQHEIAVLFVCGFGSSMIFGSFIGGMADAYGRRCFVLLFCFIYALSCLTKHMNNFHILMFGRVLGGIATSLLFSVFDAWLIRSHVDLGLTDKYLSLSFASASYGNSLTAIAAGLLADYVAELSPLRSIDGRPEHDPNRGSIYWGGYVNPFDVSLFTLILCAFVAFSTWDENYGDQIADHSNNNADQNSSTSRRQHWYTPLFNAFTTTINNRDILLCGTIASFFEGSMYIFVFMWTPGLRALAHDDDIPLGLIFSTFMVCCMAGSSLFTLALKKFKCEALAVIVFLLSALSMATVSFSNSPTAAFLAMNLFEVCVGMYWPIMGTMKGNIVPEDKRAAIYNLFRIPLNFIVLVVLLTDIKPASAFAWNALMLLVAMLLQLLLSKTRLFITSMADVQMRIVQTPPTTTSQTSDDDQV